MSGDRIGFGHLSQSFIQIGRRPNPTCCYFLKRNRFMQTAINSDKPQISNNWSFLGRPTIAP